MHVHCLVNYIGRLPQKIIAGLLLPALFFSSHQFLFAQPVTRLHIKILEADTKQVTPAMVCITNIATGNVHLPPDGRLAGEPTYPNNFYEGIIFKADNNWIGPLRKMNGKGTVNGQRTYVYGNAPSLAYWHEPVMYQVSGDFTIDLLPGAWRIAIEHGNEYVPISDTLDITGTQVTQKKTYMLNRWINLPARGWYSGDVHTHHPLNTRAFRDYMLQMGEAEDVHLVNVLQMGDRNNVYFQPQAFGKRSQVCRGNICLSSGQEEPRSNYGHIIGLNTQALARDTSAYNHYNLVFNKIHHKANALVGFAHFAYNGEGVTEGLAIYAPTGAINFVELLQNTQLNAAVYYEYLNLGFRFTATAGSDFPWGSTIGDGRTFVYTGNSFSAEKWFEGLKAGNTFVSNGPALLLTVNEQLPGSEIQVTENTTVSITITALCNPAIAIMDTVELHGNDGLIYSLPNPEHLDSLSVKIPLTIKTSQWVTAVVRCSNGALAHTSPVYILVNKKPVYNAEKGAVFIQKLLSILQKAKDVEITKPSPDKVLVETISKAENYYKNLRSASSLP